MTAPSYSSGNGDLGELRRRVAVALVARAGDGRRLRTTDITGATFRQEAELKIIGGGLGIDEGLDS